MGENASPDVSKDAGFNDTGSWMCAASGDCDNDSDFDLFATNDDEEPIDAVRVDRYEKDWFFTGLWTPFFQSDRLPLDPRDPWTGLFNLTEHRARLRRPVGVRLEAVGRLVMELGS